MIRKSENSPADERQEIGLTRGGRMNNKKSKINKLNKSSFDFSKYLIKELVEWAMSNDSSKFSPVKPNPERILRIPRPQVYFMIGFRFGIQKNETRRILKSWSHRFNFVHLNKRALEVNLEKFNKEVV